MDIPQTAAVVIGLLLVFVIIGYIVEVTRRATKQAHSAPDTRVPAQAACAVTQRPYLAIHSLDGEQVLPLTDQEHLIGRGSACDIKIGVSDPVPLVSRRHATLKCVDGDWFLIDSGSTNGTFVNGRRIVEQKLFDEDSIMLGKHTLQIRGIERRPNVPRIDGYETIRSLGTGGFGKVFLARRVADGRLVALKFPMLFGHDADRVLKRFLREMKIMCQLRSPEIVECYEAGHRDGVPYIAMEYMAGGTLRSRMPQGKPCGEYLTLSACYAVAMALDAAHNHSPGILSRDVKPENVLFSSDDRAKLSDFGIAKLIGAPPSTMSNFPVGTVMYMAPECFTEPSDRLTAAADIWSLGAMLFEMSCGRPPFLAESLLKLEHAIQEDPLPPWTCTFTCSRPLASLVAAMLDKDPSRRPLSARYVADSLHILMLET